MLIVPNKLLSLLLLYYHYTAAHSILNDFSDAEEIATSFTCVEIEEVMHKIDTLVCMRCDSVNPMFGFINASFSGGRINTIGFTVLILKTLLMYPHVYCYVVDLRSRGEEIIAQYACSAALSHKTCSNIACICAFGF